MTFIQRQQRDEELESVILWSPLLREIFNRWDEIDLANCWLVSGAVVQTYWNHQHGYSPDFGIEDIDLVYFDTEDLSAEAEDSSEKRLSDLFSEMSVPLDVKNQARVHLWYANKFGFEIPPHQSVLSAIGCFPTTAGSIGVRPNNGTLEFYAEFGFTDLLSLTVRPNKRLVAKSVYEAKATRWGYKWPRLEVLDWNEGRSRRFRQEQYSPKKGAA